MGSTELALRPPMWYHLGRMTLSLSVAFTVGLVSTLHCVSMCGGIMGALSMGLPESVRYRWGRLIAYVMAYNLGRVASYTAGGALMAAVGESMFEAISPEYGHAVLRVVAAAVMMSIGMYMAGWFPQFATIERLGVPLWRQLEPFGRRFLPIHSLLGALGFGLVWGWLPCGLVYSMLLSAATVGDSVTGAMYMLAFGAGTVLPVATAGLLAGRLFRLTGSPYVKQAAGLLIILLALLTLVFPTAVSLHSDPGAHLAPH